MIGAGVLGMSQAMQHSGLVMGMFILVVVGVLSHYGGVYIGLAGRLSGKQQLDTIAY